MHELSIAQNIIEIVSKAVGEENLASIARIRMKIGVMAGVVPESLEFSFQALTTGTALAHAQLKIESVPFRIQCHECGKISEDETGIVVCPSCAAMNTTILSGNELFVSEIELEEESNEYEHHNPRTKSSGKE